MTAPTPPAVAPGPRRAAAPVARAAPDRSARRPPDPLRRRRLLVAIAVGLACGLTVGFARGSAGIGTGHDDRAAPITAPPPPASGPTTPPAALLPPRVSVRDVVFDDGMPHDVNFRDVVYDPTRWAATGGTATVTRAGDAGPAGAEAPRYDPARDWAVDTGSLVRTVQATLVTPTPHSGVLARFQDANNYFAVLAGRDLTQVELVEVRNGKATSRGFVDHVVKPGTKLGFVSLDNQVTLSIDSEPQVLSTFFGDRSAVDDDGLRGTGIGLLVGSGQPAFDDVRFG